MSRISHYDLCGEMLLSLYGWEKHGNTITYNEESEYTSNKINIFVHFSFVISQFQFSLLSELAIKYL